MKKILPFVISLAATLTVAAAEPAILPQLKRECPDLELIRYEIQNPESPYFYPRLMAEYLRNDTLMKIDKFRRLYLGYMFQEDYTPYRSSDHRMNFAASAQPSREDCDSIIAHAHRTLEDDPFDMRNMILMINAYRQKGNRPLASIWQYKLNYLLMAIVSTGTGLDEQNAWFVIDPSHEYVLLNMLNYNVDEHVFYDPYYEYISVSDPQGNKRGGYYFNIKPMLEEYYRKHPEELNP